MPDPAGPIRVLVVAQHPLGADEFGLDRRAEIEIVHLARRPALAEGLVEELEPDIVLFDTAFPEGAAFGAITEIIASTPSTRVLALTPDPPPHDQVARAIEAGASGFIDVNGEPDEFVDAIRSVHGGDAWFPAEGTQAVLRDVVDDLDVSSANRRSRLTAIVVGLIPLAGVMAAILSILWRKYLGHIGVRPVDLGIDPGTRVVDAVSAVLFVIGVFGPFLLIGTWLALLRTATEDRPGFAWLTTRPRLAWALMALAVIAGVAFLIARADLVLVLFVGPAVLVALLGVVLDATSELPPFLRLNRLRPRRLIAVGLAFAVVFLTILSVEAIVRKPGFGPRGTEALLIDRVIGFRTQPVHVINVNDEREPRDALYLGGNADLYVLVDPCDDDEVELVSVGAHRLEVIDEVTCREPGAEARPPPTSRPQRRIRLG